LGTGTLGFLERLARYEGYLNEETIDQIKSMRDEVVYVEQFSV